jgi:hypothetical protein
MSCGSTSSLSSSVWSSVWGAVRTLGCQLALVTTVFAWVAPSQAGAPSSADGPDESEADDGVTWTLWLGPLAPRDEPFAQPLDLKAWTMLLRSLPVEMQADVQRRLTDVAAVLAGTQDQPSALNQVIDGLLSEGRERPNPLYLLLGLRSLAQASLQAEVPVPNLGSLHSGVVETRRARMAECERSAALLDHPSAPIVVGYADACMVPPWLAREAAELQLPRIRAAAARVPVERWALPFWRAALVVASSKDDRPLYAHAAAALAVIEDRACEAGCERAPGRAAMVEVQRALYACAAEAPRSGAYDLANDQGAFGRCARGRLPAERRADRVVVWRLPFD